MESILLIGACSAVDTLGKILTSSCTCFGRGAPGSFWGGRAGVELDNTSVVPVCDDSSPSEGSLIRRNVHFSQVSTISVLHKSESSHSAATTSTRSTFSAYDYEVENDHLYTYNAMPTKIKTFHAPSREEFDPLAPSSSRDTQSPEGFKLSRQQHRRSKDRHEQRHRCLGHSKRKQRVRKLLAEEVANRKRKSERKFDRD